MSDSFLEKAHEVRKRIQKRPLYLIEPKVSRYNTQVYVSTCSLCGEIASDTHHIQQQKYADEQGYIGSVHKDAVSNLLVLCENCHYEQHNGKKKVSGVQMTSEGVEVCIVSNNDTNINTMQNASTTMYNDYSIMIESMKKYLMYTIQGWSYRTDINQKWKKITPKQYEKIFEKLRKQYPVLPSQEKEIELYLQEHQSEFLSFLK